MPASLPAPAPPTRARPGAGWRRVHLFRAHHARRRPGGQAHFGLGVDACGIAAEHLHVDRGAGGHGHAGAHLAQPAFGQVARGGRQRPAAAAQQHAVGHDVPRVARVNLREAQCQRVGGLDVAADDGLHGGDHLRRRHDGVDAMFGLGCVAPLARHGDLVGVAVRHHGAHAGCHRPEGQIGRIVQREDGVAGKLREQAVPHHRQSAARVLFRRLENEMQRAPPAGPCILPAMVERWEASPSSCMSSASMSARRPITGPSPRVIVPTTPVWPNPR
ncbi:hypothetical protein G6F31_015509 [Rhizopus arrhizus]|nr:hypothetical protein G6F31_015509 [Rhizopus arrhizus]